LSCEDCDPWTPACPTGQPLCQRPRAREGATLAGSGAAGVPRQAEQPGWPVVGARSPGWKRTHSRVAQAAERRRGL